MKKENKTAYASKKRCLRGKGRGAAFFCGALASLLMLQSCKFGVDGAAQAAFERGAAAYNAMDMETAKRELAECCRLDGALYADAKQYLDGIAEYERLYLQGVSAYENGDYNAASSAFLGIKGYLNIEDYLERIESLKEDYEKAVKMYENGEYLASRESFQKLGDYQRSAAYIANVDSMIGLYNEGIALMNRKSYVNAGKAFEAINTSFLDSAELSRLCAARQSSETVKLGEYIYSYNKEYGGDIWIVSGNSGILFDMKDSRGLMICGAMDESGVVRYISFCVPGALKASLGQAGLNEAFAHCIRALNPELSEFSEILSDMEAYSSENGRLYGCMRVHMGAGVDGITVMTAEYEADEDD